PQATDLFTKTAPPIFHKAGIDLRVIPVPLGTADLTPQIQQVATDGTGLAFVVGNDALCISAFNALRSVGYTGKIAAIAQCITETTRKSVPGSQLDGMVISAQTPVGTNDPSMQIYEDLIKAYGHDVDVDNALGVGMFTTLAALASAIGRTSGELTPESV